MVMAYQEWLLNNAPFAPKLAFGETKALNPTNLRTLAALEQSWVVLPDCTKPTNGVMGQVITDLLLKKGVITKAMPTAEIKWQIQDKMVSISLDECSPAVQTAWKCWDGSEASAMPIAQQETQLKGLYDQAVSLSIKKGTLVTEAQAAYEKAMLQDPDKHFGTGVHEYPKRYQGLEDLE